MERDTPAMADPAGSEDRAAAWGTRWILFDGDNTLWHIEMLYDQARQDLIRYVARSGVDVDEIEAFQRLEDKRLFAELGYSSARFPTSFEHTVGRFLPNATPGQMRYARRLARAVFERPAEIDPDAPRVLVALRGSYNLALITAGERWVQERRLAEFHYTNIFDAVRIVERKTAELFDELVASLAINVEESWVIGDSMKSDIIPALDAGLNAILIANRNWVEVEHDEIRPSQLRVVDRLGGILPIIAGSGIGSPTPAHA
jgi:putative hydrolase of the HAD superfamily